MSLTSRSLPATVTILNRLSQLRFHPRAARPLLVPSVRKMSSIPSTMRAVIVEKHGGSEVLQYKEEYEVPQIQDSQILVKNNYGGVNYIDTYFRTGLYPARGWPMILGQEGIGTVAAVGKSNPHNLKVGDRVVWMSFSTSAMLSSMPPLSNKLVCSFIRTI